MDNEKIKFNIKQKEKIISLGLNLDFSKLSDDDLVLIEDTVGNRLVDISEEWWKHEKEEKLIDSILDLLS